MPTGPYVTGPARFWVQTPGTGSPRFLLYSERAPRIRILPLWESVHSSHGGTKHSVDEAYQGKEALVTTRDTYRDAAVLRDLIALRGVLHTVNEGTDELGDLGTLMIHEAKTSILWVHFPYNTKVAYAAQNVVAGYRFFASYLAGPHDFDDLGTIAQKNSHIFVCKRLFSKETGAWTCYDHDMTAVSGLTPT